MRSERWDVQIARRMAYFGVFALIYSKMAAAAPPLEFPIVVQCPGWSAERAAQVEARIRTTLVAEALEAQRVGVLCDATGGVSVAVESEHGALVKPVLLSNGRLEDEVVATVESALRELMPQPAAPEAKEAAKAAPEPPSAASAKATVAAPAARGAQATPPVRRSVFKLTPLLERWTEYTAWGADVGLAIGSENFAYGLELGGRAAIAEPATFNVSEWNAALRFAWTFPRAAGLRGTLGLGVSLLVTTPATGVDAVSATLLPAGCLELHLGRPFWLGAFGLEPQLGLRLFSGERRVRVNDTEQLVVPLLVPQAGLSFLFRPE